LINILCHGNKNCATNDYQRTFYNAKADKTTQTAKKYPTYGIQLSGVSNQHLADQIIKDLQALFAVLAPPPKPAENK